MKVQEVFTFIMKPFHNWELTPEEAIQAQQELHGRIELSWDNKRIVNTVGGVDMGITASLPAVQSSYCVFLNSLPLKV